MNNFRLIFCYIAITAFHRNYADAQSFNNITLVVENSVVVVYYDLVDSGYSSEGSLYTIRPTFKSDNKGVMSPSSVTGDLFNVKAGPNKTIVWNDTTLIAQLQGNLSVELECTLSKKNLLTGKQRVEDSPKKTARTNAAHFFRTMPFPNYNLNDSSFWGISVDGYTSSRFSLGIRYIRDVDHAVLLGGKLFVLGTKETILKCYIGGSIGPRISNWTLVNYLNTGLNISIGPISLLGEYFLSPTRFIVVGAGFNF